MPNATCRIEDCTKPGRSAGQDICPMHYHRQYRHGDPTKVARADPRPRYILVSAPGHPLGGNGHNRMYQHRVVLYDQIGPGSHPCHWCGELVTWTTERRPDALQVDHLNDDKRDNRSENLVASCGGCNGRRGSQSRHERLKAKGFWSANDTVARTGRGRTEPVRPLVF